MDLDLRDSFVEFFLVLPVLFPHKHLLLCWTLRVKDLSTCALAIALGASVCALHEDSWKLKVCELVTLGSMDPRRLSGDSWEPPIWLWVRASSLVV